MSYTKIQFKENILIPQQKIQEKTIQENDLSSLLLNIDAIFKISDTFEKVDPEVGKIWNDIISDLISSISSACSGFYRSAIVNLRSILELSCNTFFYIDHKIEHYLFEFENAKADKYVSSLIRDYNFFTSKYIKSFKADIKYHETNADSISLYLKKIYASLSDVVHGRYNSLLKVNNIEIQYEIGSFKTYEDLLSKTIGIICTMFIYRFNNDRIAEINSLALKTGVIKE
ncbi:hypothetical protein [Bacillus cereus]|uniref:hypothetical protein n=1 Tax=Bacillus cereus TaxID=1396 RepID=UPI003D64CB41